MKLKITLVAVALLFPLVVLADDTNNPVLASNAKATVRKLDLDAEMQRIPESERQSVLVSRKRLAQLVENVLTAKTLSREAEELELDKNVSLQAEIQLARDKVLARARMEKFASELKLPDFFARAKEIYTLQAEKLVRPSIIDVSHILIDTKCRKSEEALERAREVRAKLMGKEAVFGDIAKMYSDDPSISKNGGTLVEDINNFEGAFTEAALKLKPGELSDPIKTSQGYHIIRLNAYMPGKKITFEEKKSELITQLKDEYLSDAYNNYISMWRNHPSIKINEAAMEAQVTDWKKMLEKFPSKSH